MDGTVIAPLDNSLEQLIDKFGLLWYNVYRTTKRAHFGIPLRSNSKIFCYFDISDASNKRFGIMYIELQSERIQ